MGRIVGGIQVATACPDLSHHGLWGIRLLGIGRLGRCRLNRGLQQGRAGMVRVIRGVEVASGRQAGYGRSVSRRPAGAGGGDRERPGTRHVGAEVRRDRGKIIHRLVRQDSSAGEIAVDPIRTGVIGGQKAGRAKPVIHFANIGGARQNAVVRVVRVVAELVAHPQLLIGGGHDLHQAHRPDRGGGLLLTARFLLHHRAHPPLGHAVSRRSLADIGSPRILLWARRRVIVRRPPPPVRADFHPSAARAI